MTVPRPTPAGEPGDTRAPGAQRADPPRARPAAPAARDRADRSLAYGIVAGVIGAAVLFVLAGPLSVDTGLLAVGVAIGWVVGVAVRTGAGRAGGAARPAGGRAVTAVALAVGGSVAAWVGAWAWSRVQGGVLGPVDFVSQVYGLLLPVQLVFTAAAAWIGSR
ncbi:MAG: hypothetical protein MUE82_02870 [Chloroflexi bacterium]|nr:hypothetical protein [Chloroflexota bacterium]